RSLRPPGVGYERLGFHPRILIVATAPSPTLGECRHSFLARGLIAVDGRAIFVVAVGQRPEPRHPHGGGGGFQDARATTAVRVSYSGVNRSSSCKLHQTK